MYSVRLLVMTLMSFAACSKIMYRGFVMTLWRKANAAFTQQMLRRFVTDCWVKYSPTNLSNYRVCVCVGKDMYLYQRELPKAFVIKKS